MRKKRGGPLRRQTLIHDAARGRKEGQDALRESRSPPVKLQQSLPSCDRSISSAVQRDASCFLYNSQTAALEPPSWWHRRNPRGRPSLDLVRTIIAACFKKEVGNVATNDTLNGHLQCLNCLVPTQTRKKRGEKCVALMASKKNNNAQHKA